MKPMDKKKKVKKKSSIQYVIPAKTMIFVKMLVREKLAGRIRRFVSVGHINPSRRFVIVNMLRQTLVLQRYFVIDVRNPYTYPAR